MVWLYRTDGDHSRTRKLDSAAVCRLREAAAAGASDAELAKEFGIAATYAGLIRTGRVWRGAGGPLTRRQRGRRPQ